MRAGVALVTFVSLIALGALRAGGSCGTRGPGRAGGGTRRAALAMHTLLALVALITLVAFFTLQLIGADQILPVCAVVVLDVPILYTHLDVVRGVGGVRALGAACQQHRQR